MRRPLPGFLLLAAGLAGLAGRHVSAEEPAPDLAAAGDELRISADLLEMEGVRDDGGALRIVGTGGVRVQSGRLQVRAPRLEYTRDRRRAVLDGGVIGVDGPALLVAKRLELDLDARTVTLTDGLFRLARGIDERHLLEAIDRGDDPAALGRTQLLLRAGTLARGDGDTLRASGLWLTTCDCAPDAVPFLSASAAEANIRPGDVAELSWVLVRLFGVPVLPLPYLPLPLAARRSGVLFPNVILSGPGGAGLELPLFLELGESADLTLRPRWLLGTDDSRAGAAGVSGPGLPAELRWAPLADATGSLRLDHQLDLSPAASGRPGAVRGHRAALALAHSQPLPGGRLVVDAEALSDGAYLRDTSPLLERARLPYLRSRAAASLADGPRGLALESTVIQLLSGDRTRFDRLPAAVAPVARVVGFHALSLGPVLLDAQASLSLEAPTPGLSLAPDATRAGRLVGAASLSQSWSALRGAGASLVIEAGERAEALVGADGTLTQRVGGFGGLRGQLRLERDLGGGWTHELSPAFRLRALGAVGSAGYDRPRAGPTLTPPSVQADLDAALPAGFEVQAIARLGTAWRQGGFVPLALGLEHHPALAPFGPGQLRVVTDSMLGRHEELGRLNLGAAWDFAGRRVASAGAAWNGPLPVAAGRLRFGASWLDGASDDQLLRPLDSLFVPVAGVAPSAPLMQADASVDLTLAPGLAVRAGALLSGSAASPRLAHQYTGMVTWDAGGCARLWLQLGWNSHAPNAPPFGGFGLELGDVSTAIAAAASALSAP